MTGQWAMPESIQQQLSDWQNVYSSSLLRVRSLGASRQGRSISLVSLGAEQAPYSVVLVCGQHGDERDSVQACLYLLNDLLQRAQEPLWKARLQRTQLHVLPVLNPDGLALNRRYNAAGVNLNANWDGETAFSEPETQALRDWVQAQAQITTLVDYHTGTASFSQGMVLYPFTYATSDRLSPAQRAMLYPLAQKQAQLLSASDPQREAFMVLQTHEINAALGDAMRRLLPPAYVQQALAQLPANNQAPGSLIDWSFGELGIPSLGFEVSRPFPDLNPHNIADFQTFSEHLLPAFRQAMGALLDG
ncbi:MAG: M14 family metallopeptidase [Candidatus Sericytochromatia bacterium]